MAAVLGSYASTLTPLQLTAGQALLQNQGLRVNPIVPAVITFYVGQPLISTYLTMFTAAKAGTGNLSNVVINVLGNIASTTCAALADGQPQLFLNLGVFANVAYPPGLTGIVGAKANIYLGSPTGTANNWNTNRFVQIFSACQSFKDLANQFILSACQANDYLCDTFTNTNNSITGDITQISLDNVAFGQDLANLGNLWDMTNLNNLGSPLALAQRLVTVVGNVPIISLTFLGAGVPESVVVNLDNPRASVDDSAQRAMYTAMTQITGNNLTQILQILGVTTVGITTMADLLNPYKLFPNSFQSLTVPTAQGSRPIYTNTTGDVNTTLIQLLPPYILSSTV